MAVATLTPLAPAEAIAGFQRRGQRLDPTFSWQDAWEAEHAAMFTVAKSAGFDILKDIHDALTQALAEGTTFQDFARDLRPVLEAKGWWGRKEVADPATGEIRPAQLGSTRRLRTIFDTNMRVSYASGHWAQFERNRKARPVLRYVAILDGRVRPAHRARHNLTLPVDDPYWDTWAPPCGWGCRCTLQSLSIRDVERMRGELKFTPPAETTRRFTNRGTGEVVKVPDGIDPGWGYNPGKVGWLAAPIAAKLVDAPPVLAAAAQADLQWPIAKIDNEFKTWFTKVFERKAPPETRMTIGALDSVALDALAQNGVSVASGAIAVEAQDIPAFVAALIKKNPAAVALLEHIPEGLRRPRAMYLGKGGTDLLYVVEAPGMPEAGQIIARVPLSRVSGLHQAMPRIEPNVVREVWIGSAADLAVAGNHRPLMTLQ